MRSSGWSKALNALGAILLSLGILAGLVNREVLDSQRFANHVDQIRRDPAVTKQVGAIITTEVLAQNPNLLAVRPLLEAASTTLAGSTAFSPIVRYSAQQLHQAFTVKNASNVALRVVDIGAVLTATLTALAPETVSQIPPDLSVTLAQAGGQSFAATTIHLTWIVGWLAWLLPLLGLLLLAGGVYLAISKLRAMIRVGYAIVAAGAGVGVAALVGATIASVADENTFTGAIVAASWRDVGGIVWRAAALTVIAGALVIAVATARLPRVDPSTTLRKVWSRAVRVPESKWGRIGHGAALVVVGIGALERPTLVLQLVVSVVGIVLLVAGLSELAIAAGARRPDKNLAPRTRMHWTVGVGVVTSVALLVGLVGLNAAPAGTTVAVTAGSGPSDACNGHKELCDRRYNDVAFPAAHNAMSAADEPGWFIPEQPTGVVGALDAGVTVLLVDSYYGQSTNTPDLVATAPESLESARAQTEALYGPSVVASAQRVRDSIAAKPTGPVKAYLCHGFCEIGSTEWEPVMQNVRAWMDAHPRVVVTFFIEDSVTPADTAKVFEQAGLLPYVWTQKKGEPWPTLGQMIDSGHRLVVLQERHGGGTAYPWMLQGFDWVQDTNYTNPTLADLNCRLNRGSARNPIFGVNVWLSGFTALVTNAKKVNAYDFLDPYLQRCEKERGQIPNYVAVNFFNEPNVFKAVDQLNGFG